MSSSGNAPPASGLGYPGHESGELEDLFRPLRRSQLSVVAAECRALGFPVRAPVADSLTLLHDLIAPPAAGLSAPMGGREPMPPLIGRRGPVCLRTSVSPGPT
jgi:hypothetical protein